MERRFVILLADTEQTWGLPYITESELKKRLSVIVLGQQWGPPNTWDEAIDILLHGEAVPPAK